MQEINQAGTPLELNCPEISQGLILPCETQAQGRALVCGGSHIGGKNQRSVP